MRNQMRPSCVRSINTYAERIHEPGSSGRESAPIERAGVNQSRLTSAATVQRGEALHELSVTRVQFEPVEPTALELLLARLLVRAMKTFPEPHFKLPLARAARDAAMLAEDTGVALLLLPELFAELAIAAMLKAEYLRMGRI